MKNSNLNIEEVYLDNIGPVIELYNKNTLSNKIKYELAKKNVKFYIIDAYKIAKENNIPNKISMIMENAIVYITKVLPHAEFTNDQKESIKLHFSKKGDEIVNNNINAIKDIENKIVKVEVDELWKNLSYSEEKYTGIIDNIMHLKEDNIIAVKGIFTPNHEDNTGSITARKIMTFMRDN